MGHGGSEMRIAHELAVTVGVREEFGDAERIDCVYGAVYSAWQLDDCVKQPVSALPQDTTVDLSVRFGSSLTGAVHIRTEPCDRPSFQLMVSGE